jgi:hypothetical protein
VTKEEWWKGEVAFLKDHLREVERSGELCATYTEVCVRNARIGCIRRALKRAQAKLDELSQPKRKPVMKCWVILATARVVRLVIRTKRDDITGIPAWLHRRFGGEWRATQWVPMPGWYLATFERVQGT